MTPVSTAKVRPAPNPAPPDFNFHGRTFEVPIVHGVWSLTPVGANIVPRWFSQKEPRIRIGEIRPRDHIQSPILTLLERIDGAVGTLGIPRRAHQLTRHPLQLIGHH